MTPQKRSAAKRHGHRFLSSLQSTDDSFLVVVLILGMGKRERFDDYIRADERARMAIGEGSLLKQGVDDNSSVGKDAVAVNKGGRGCGLWMTVSK